MVDVVDAVSRGRGLERLPETDDVFTGCWTVGRWHGKVLRRQTRLHVHVGTLSQTLRSEIEKEIIS